MISSSSSSLALGAGKLSTSSSRGSVCVRFLRCQIRLFIIIDTTSRPDVGWLTTPSDTSWFSTPPSTRVAGSEDPSCDAKTSLNIEHGVVEQLLIGDNSVATVPLQKWPSLTLNMKFKFKIMKLNHFFGIKLFMLRQNRKRDHRQAFLTETETEENNPNFTMDELGRPRLTTLSESEDNCCSNSCDSLADRCGSFCTFSPAFPS